MRINPLLSLAALACLLAAIPAQAQQSSIPKPLVTQIEKLVALLGDGYAVGYPAASMSQSLTLADQHPVVLAVFTVEGYKGGNNFRQFLAAFSPEQAEGKTHYSLVDVIPIGAGGWRSLDKLEAKVTGQSKFGGTVLALPALENISDDAVNFPSKKTQIRLLLEQGRFKEIK